MYAVVAINLPVEGVFHYHIPAELAGRLEIGHLVEVSFGPQKAQGLILSFEQRSPVAATKPILRVIERNPMITEQQIALARWLSTTYLATLADCARLFIPPGISRRGDMLYTPVIDPEQIEAEDDTQHRLLRLLSQRGPLRGRQLARSLPRRNWRHAVERLMNRGLLLREPVLDPPTVKPKEVNIVELIIPAAQAEEFITGKLNPEDQPSNRRAAAVRRSEIVRLIVTRRRPVHFSEIYAEIDNSKIADIRALAELEMITLRKEEAWRDPLQDISFTPDQIPRLTRDQVAAWQVIEELLTSGQTPQPVLLHGVTGSGKTELYLRAVAHILERGQSAIVLVPEIALTPQTIRRFGARFPGEVGVIHSSLSPGERYDTWRRIHSGQIQLVIGARSALFTPVRNPGLIIIDECHDDSYKQTPPIAPPYYHAVPTAIELARQHNTLVIMGSATPNVATYAKSAAPDELSAAEQFLRLDLPTRIMGHRKAIEAQAVHFRIDHHYTHNAGDPEEAVMIELPPVEIVDMRQELRAKNRSIFSRSLQEALSETLERGEQAILFLNRRGAATYVFCRACGYVFECPHDQIPLTWHMPAGTKDVTRGILVCHHCDYRTGHPEVCPNCGSDQVKYFGAGTERVEKEVQKLFPAALPLRWDRDTTGAKGSHAQLLQRFIDREANVLIGTQMVAKGLDLPLVTLVGVISADTALYLPDYRSGERTFQLLTQVAGRAGRGLLGGRVILQTYAPDNYAIQAAAHHDYHTFYGQEREYRHQLGYPPFSRLARIVVRAETSELAQEEGKRLLAILTNRIREDKHTQTTLIGPAPCFYPRENKLFRWHIIIRGPEPGSILDGLATSQNLMIDIDPVSLL